MAVWQQMDESRVLIPKHGKMLVDGIVYASPKLMAGGVDEAAMKQVMNVATLPGIVGKSIAMPDIHWGYGFPIGGVAAFDARDGVVSPGGVGFDINCGVRLMATELTAADIKARMEQLADTLFQAIPTGVGSTQRDLRLDRSMMRAVCSDGAAWAVKQGFGSRSDLHVLEDQGAIKGADFDAVSDKAFERGRNQLGTLGSGNHFVEVEVVDEIYDFEAAEVFGLFLGQIVVTVHTGSRGFGHQICTDYLPVMDKASRQAGIALVDRQLACAPLNSNEGRQYMAAMACAANYAFANRQIIGFKVQESFEQALRKAPDTIGMRVVYDVAHNIAKIENHVVDGKKRKLCVHRKGATRALPPGHEDVPIRYKSVGQPVLVPGDMGSPSFVLKGQLGAARDTFASACHGAGRLLSRAAAMKSAKGRRIADELAKKGIIVRATGRTTLAEEIPQAYKDASEVVEVVHTAGIAAKVARMSPLVVVKG
jgi:tRNA-splicing ligase RtcB